MKYYDKLLKGLLKEESLYDCIPYCAHISSAMEEMAPTIFNKKVCIDRCIKHRLHKLERKLNEKKPIHKK